jgi:hypothetical protein
MQTLGRHFDTLTRDIFARHGFAQGDLIAHWPQIAGEALAAICKPERIKWPHGEAARKSGGTLLVRSHPGRALDVQYQAPRLMERINQVFGYQAVTSVKVAASTELPPAKVPKPRLPEPSPEQIEQIPVDDPGLRHALARLGTHMRASKRSPQAR